MPPGGHPKHTRARAGTAGARLSAGTRTLHGAAWLCPGPTGKAPGEGTRRHRFECRTLTGPAEKSARTCTKAEQNCLERNQGAGQRSGRTGAEALGGQSRGLHWSSVDSRQSLRRDLWEPVRGLGDAGGIRKETDWRKAGLPTCTCPQHTRSSQQVLGSC